MVPVLATGFGVGLSLIVAIGAQNAYVLRQGIRAEHVLPLVAICAVSDAVLILAGITGIGTVVAHAPATLTVVRWAGAAFLVGYGLLAARRAVGTQSLDTASGGGAASRRTAVLTMLAMTWLNPHVYLDTVLLLGSIANTHEGSGRWTFGAGAALASFAWFAALGYGARLLGRVFARPVAWRVFARPVAWRVLDALIAIVMVTIGVSLVANG
ncbi:amino acid transporter [Plantactinospora sp. S1510]|uniref:Amino acid transporter n=1 Tax=Plantactinospora alkalitolerans TaxID=2789879 RepID=A0ABS0GY68_9ACTN|nr:LysE/ArgO family amino acid transporter [Plantactinospora alkalitolerans]MBF9130899.1 amino acid transporter [Plantactinospora alkalitolerans]